MDVDCYLWLMRNVSLAHYNILSLIHNVSLQNTFRMDKAAAKCVFLHNVPMQIPASDRGSTQNLTPSHSSSLTVDPQRAVTLLIIILSHCALRETKNKSHLMLHPLLT